MKSLLETIEDRYIDYTCICHLHGQTPLSEEDFINKICSQLEQSVYVQMQNLLEDHP